MSSLLMALASLGCTAAETLPTMSLTRSVILTWRKSNSKNKKNVRTDPNNIGFMTRDDRYVSISAGGGSASSPRVRLFAGSDSTSLYFLIRNKISKRDKGCYLPIRKGFFMDNGVLGRRHDHDRDNDVNHAWRHDEWEAVFGE